jgi:hypothetical protein
LIYLGLEQISRKWTMPIKSWKAALQQFAILCCDPLRRSFTVSSVDNNLSLISMNSVYAKILTCSSSKVKAELKRVKIDTRRKLKNALQRAYAKAALVDIRGRFQHCGYSIA